MPLCEALPSRRGRGPHHAHKDRVGTWELSCLTTGNVPTWSASGRRGVVADDARAREVGLRHSSRETDEQGGAIRCGAGGAKGGGQRECETAQHVPGSVPGKRVTGAGAHTASSPSFTRGGSRMRESRTYGSVRGALSNGRPYRDRCARKTSCPSRQLVIPLADPVQTQRKPDALFRGLENDER